MEIEEEREEKRAVNLHGKKNGGGVRGDSERRLTIHADPLVKNESRMKGLGREGAGAGRGAFFYGQGGRVIRQGRESGGNGGGAERR